MAAVFSIASIGGGESRSSLLALCNRDFDRLPAAEGAPVASRPRREDGANICSKRTEL